MQTTTGMPVRHTWSESDRFVPRSVVQPVQRLLDHEAAGGIVMLVAAVVAIVWANSPWSQSYLDLWATPLRVELGDVLQLDHLSLQAWVNDALMTVFFLLVGLEIRREAVHGELQDLRAGVLLGLLVGKPVGVLAASFLAVRLGVGRLPEGTSWPQMAGLGVCAGIGFTVALFVTTLSFDDPALADSAKVGILAASVLAGAIGYLLLRATSGAGTSAAADDETANEPTVELLPAAG